MKCSVFSVLVVAALLASCGQTSGQPTTAAIATATVAATATAAPAAAPSPSPTADPYAAYTIDHMRSRTYGGGSVEIVETAGQNSSFTRYLMRYPSDGIHISGFMDVPSGDGPLPVVIALHGYVDPAVYTTLDYTTRYADALASAGFLVLHPNLRNFPPSDAGEDLFRVGMATDVLNLIAIVKQTGGQPGPLQKADPNRIGMWGHSMGGGITTRVITVSPDVKAAVLYSPVSGDELKNYLAVGAWSNNQRGQDERAVPATELQHISPMYYYNDVQAAVSINQGLADPLIPPDWSRQTCQQLQAVGKTVECHYYQGESHTFQGQGDRDFIQTSIQFLNKYLR